MEILNKQHFYFLTNFKELILSKGHQLIFNKFIDKNDELKFRPHEPIKINTKPL